MSIRRSALVTLATVLVVLASVAAVPAVATNHFPEPAPRPAALPGGADVGTDDPPDPEEDVLGWERGYWHNESVDVDQTDGLSAAELDALVARTMARVERVRRLEFTERVPVRVMSREEFAELWADWSPPRAYRTLDNAKYEALFLIGERNDSIEVRKENLGGNVAGFYSSYRDSLVLVAENASVRRVDELTLAHELVHALQDQQFGRWRRGAGTRDRHNANDGLSEGDASLVTHLYERACKGGEWAGTCVRPPGEDVAGDLANVGRYLVLYQPYSDGPSFVQYLRERGGWEAVNDAYARPPRSAEQVIHPEKYLSDPPTDVRLRDRIAGSWERVRPTGRPTYGVLGEGGLAVMFAYPLYVANGSSPVVGERAWFNRTAGGNLSDFDPLNYALEPSAGWDGDRLHAYRNAANETAYVWRIVWDTERDAREFREGYRRLLEYWGAERVGRSTWVIEEGRFADAFHVDVEGRNVTVVNAPTVEALGKVREGVVVRELTPTPTPTPTATPTPVGTASEGPAEGTPSPTPPRTVSRIDGFGPVVGVVALALAGALFARRREGT